MVKKEWIEKGYVDEPIDETLDLKAEIRKLCKEKDAIILAHYYTVGEIQDIANFTVIPVTTRWSPPALSNKDWCICSMVVSMP